MKYHTLQLPITDIRPPEAEYVFLFSYYLFGASGNTSCLEGLVFLIVWNPRPRKLETLWWAKVRECLGGWGSIQSCLSDLMAGTCLANLRKSTCR